MHVLHTPELIRKKRDGETLSDGEVQELVRGISDHSVTDAQIAAFTMAVWFRGMGVAEQLALTLAMRDSGTTLAWGGLNGPVLDKHSTGGVGDLVSLLLGPMVAACGGYVPMISGRGLGHTGGTLDKLESIPGFDTRLSKVRFQQLVREVGIAIIGQTDYLAPADRRIYAVRDITATINSVPLIVSSILSKKLAEGLDALVLDIKVGRGAFMEELEHARLLALDICRVAVDSGLACNAVITDMNQPLAWSAGNALEVHEAIAYLRGDHRHNRLHAVVIETAAELLVLGGLQIDLPEARLALRRVLDSGAAAECFARMVVAQGGPADLLQRSDDYLPAADFSRPVLAGQSGYVQSVNLKSIGLAVVRLGGGRVRAEDPVDHSVGISDLCQPGVRLEADTPIAILHARTEKQWLSSAAEIRRAVELVDIPLGGAQSPVIWERIEGARSI